MDTDSVVGGHVDAGDHVGVAGDEDDVGDLLATGRDDHVRDETGVHRLLGAAFTPFDELAGAQLHAVAGPQGPLVTVRAGFWNTVIPELTVDGLVELVLDHRPEDVDDLGQINF